MAFRLNGSSRVSDSALWTFIGARDLADRSNHVAFWDSTQIISRYYYKFSTVSLTDSAGKTRPIGLQLTLTEKEKTIHNYLISGNTRSLHIFHMLCLPMGTKQCLTQFLGKLWLVLAWLFHLFDQNVKANVLPQLHITTRSLVFLGSI